MSAWSPKSIFWFGVFSSFPINASIVWLIAANADLTHGQAIELSVSLSVIAALLWSTPAFTWMAFIAKKIGEQDNETAKLKLTLKWWLASLVIFLPSLFNFGLIKYRSPTPTLLGFCYFPVGTNALLVLLALSANLSKRGLRIRGIIGPTNGQC